MDNEWIIDLWELAYYDMLIRLISWRHLPEEQQLVLSDIHYYGEWCYA